MGVFDGLADIFSDVFGEAVIYTPVSGAPIAINAIWWESSAGLPGADGVFEDVQRTELHVRAADISPQEGATATRVADGRVMLITTPIRPDGKGMIMCNLAAIDA